MIFITSCYRLNSSVVLITGAIKFKLFVMVIKYLFNNSETLCSSALKILFSKRETVDDFLSLSLKYGGSVF